VLGGVVVRLGDRLLGRVNRWLARAGVPPLLLNGLEFLSAIGCGACLAQRRLAPAIALLAVHGVCDYLDGGLQRAAPVAHAPSVSAPFLHAVGDKLSDLFLYLALGWGGWVAWWLAVAAAFASVAATAVGWWGESRRQLKRDACLFDRSDRIVVLLVLAPCARFAPAALAAVLMSLVDLAQRWRWLRAPRAAGG